MVENLAHLGLEVTLVEKLNQVMPPLDPEMARLVERYLIKHGVRLELNDGVAGFRQVADGSLEVLTGSGKAHPADVVILAIGVRPETALAKAAGLEIGQRGGIRVDEHMRTSDPDILAVGDAVEVKDYVTGQWTLIPLAGPANRQGRIAADVIAGRESRYRGTQGTSICQIFEAAIGQTGVSEKTLRQLGDTDFEKIYLYLNSHAGYYPGAKMMAIKVLFRKSDGRLLGAQVLAEDGVAKRVDAFAMAIQMKATIYDLEEAELCYAPPFGSAKDPVNFAGMVAGNVLRGDMPLSHWDGASRPSCSTCAIPRNWKSSRSRGRSTSRCHSFAPVSKSCPATGRFTSSVAPAGAPITRRASCFRTGSRPGTSRAACCPARTAPRAETARRGSDEHESDHRRAREARERPVRRRPGAGPARGLGPGGSRGRRRLRDGRRDRGGQVRLGSPGARAPRARPRVPGPGGGPRPERAGSRRATWLSASSAAPTRCPAPTARWASGTCAGTASTPSAGSSRSTASCRSAGASSRSTR